MKFNMIKTSLTCAVLATLTTASLGHAIDTLPNSTPMENLGQATLHVNIDIIIPANQYYAYFQGGAQVERSEVKIPGTYCLLSATTKALNTRFLKGGQRVIELSGEAESGAPNRAALVPSKNEKP